MTTLLNKNILLHSDDYSADIYYKLNNEGAANNMPGRELLHLQGLQFDDAVVNQFTEPQLCDLAGNSYSESIWALGDRK